MIGVAETLTTTEAAVVSRVSPRDVNRVIDEHILPAAFLDPEARRKVASAGCALISFYYASAKQLTADERMLAIAQVGPRLRADGLGPKRPRKTEWLIHNDFVTINLAPFVMATQERLARLHAARKMVSSSRWILSGTPVIAGTRVPVHDVAASLNAGFSDENLLEAYPSIKREHLVAST